MVRFLVGDPRGFSLFRLRSTPPLRVLLQFVLLQVSPVISKVLLSTSGAPLRFLLSYDVLSLLTPSLMGSHFPHHLYLIAVVVGELISP